MFKKKKQMNSETHTQIYNVQIHYIYVYTIIYMQNTKAYKTKTCSSLASFFPHAALSTVLITWRCSHCQGNVGESQLVNIYCNAKQVSKCTLQIYCEPSRNLHVDVFFFIFAQPFSPQQVELQITEFPNRSQRPVVRKTWPYKKANRLTADRSPESPALKVWR